MFKPTMNFHRGFMSWEFFRGQEADAHRLGAVEGLPVERHTRRLDAPPFELVQWLRNTRARRREEDYTFPQCVRRACDFVDEAREMGPFFLWVDSFEAHEPWDPPVAYADEYFEGPRPDIEPIVPRGEDLSPREEDRARALYFGSCTFVDKWIGVLLNHVADAGLLDDTVIVFTSDHGVQLGEHGVIGKSWRHMNAYNTRVNMIVRHPAGPSGRVVPGFVQHIDLAPAVLDWLGVSHEQLDGDNLWDLATGARSGLRDWVLTVWAHEASVRDDTWNAVVNVQDPDPQWRLYRVDDDRDSFTDVASRYPEALAGQRERLEGFLGGPLPARLSGRHSPSRYPIIEFERARRRGLPAGESPHRPRS